jgi:EAL domain-containing protein (putative c-di-GMP-specific phosphodiesterase class I)
MSGAGGANQMHRPKFVSDAITVCNDLHVGHYGPFALYSAFQPIYRLGAGGPQLVGFEGLIRAEEGGKPVSPNTLFSSVDADDRLFIECMCRALHLRNYRQAQPVQRTLFININPAIYESVAVIEREFDFMFSILARYGLGPEFLICEILETEAQSPETMARLCSKLRQGGVRIAIDDFGVGNSGVDRFHTLMPDIVKVDGGLFRQLAQTSAQRKMLASLTRTLVSHGAMILIEGIENEQHLMLACDLGAALVQGYYLGRPEKLPFRFPDVFGSAPSLASLELQA